MSGYNSQNTPDQFDSDWYEIECNRVFNSDGTDRLDYSLLHLAEDVWAYQVNWLTHSYFNVGTRRFYVEGYIYDDDDNVEDTFSTKEGKDYFRTTRQFDLFNQAFLDTAMKHYNVPYIWGYAVNSNGENISKLDKKGYVCLDCSGLAVWTLLKKNVNLFRTGTNKQIVGSVDSHTLWEICRDHYTTSIAYGGWDDGYIVFLDANNNSVVDHCAFWVNDFSNGANYGKILHALGGSTRHSVADPNQERGKVVYQNTPREYIEDWLFDCAYIPTTALTSKNGGKQHEFSN
ncbi:MAG: hypothetical protein GWN62_12770 [Aliifodinibius sp.]|nr:hypothetical protein [Fodinibius sp.]